MRIASPPEDPPERHLLVSKHRARWDAGRWLLREAVTGIPSGTRLRFFATTVLALTVSGLLVLAPILFSSAVDALAERQAASDALTRVAGSIVLFGCAKLLIEQRWFVYQPAENCFLNAVRRLYLQHILSLPAGFHANRSIGKLDLIVGRGIGGLQSLSSTIFTQVAPLIFETLATILAAIVFLSPDMAAVLAATVATHLLILVYGAEHVSRRFRTALNTSIAAQGEAGDAILNAEGVKALAIEDVIVGRYDKALQASHGAFRAFYEARGNFGLFLSGILVTGFAAALGLTTTKVLKGELSVGDLVLTNTYLLQLFRSIESFSFSYRDARQSFTAFTRFVDLFTEPAENDRGKLKVPSPIERISVKEVGFTYPDGRRALQPTSLNIERGKITALLGESGSGKSTLARLLLKLYPVSEGSITINGIPLSEIDARDLRRDTAIVPQDAIMFKASLAFNIALSDRPDPERLRQSIEAARLSNLVQRLAEGIETEIGERGLKLSGGERQRVAIARALYRNPQVLILDEATSALDEITRDELLATISDLAHSYATLVVTHDPAVAAMADHVVRMAPPASSGSSQAKFSIAIEPTRPGR
ncbi:ABC transporter ATP-binding protein [Microvirga thermotolerans]|uniref:ATP-binding cassette domain-containing protein n=1 Tax=Microvirga thermotolerans TaxID=2651334 RepID=A0A5P9JYB7_9HYPH|nr:ABC transporter ATP-binding protein [Microvirga thermotolerans]QFU17239.1 ATP-binding cassette domain-containing protein [Microvirga thermotolerans]